MCVCVYIYTDTHVYIYKKTNFKTLFLAGKGQHRVDILNKCPYPENLCLLQLAVVRVVLLPRVFCLRLLWLALCFLCPYLFL
jgi:hypothetical protein